MAFEPDAPRDDAADHEHHGHGHRRVEENGRDQCDRRGKRESGERPRTAQLFERDTPARDVGGHESSIWSGADIAPKKSLKSCSNRGNVQCTS